MISLLKTFGKGLLYVIGAPFFIVALLLFGVIGLVAFIFQIIKSIIYFFTGQKFFPELAEDKELRLMKESAYQNNEVIKENNEMVTPIYEEVVEQKQEPIFIQREPESPTIEETVFEDTSSLEDLIKDEEEIEQDQFTQEEAEEEKQTILETNEETEDVQEEEEELETYVPRSSTYSDVDDEENDTDSGVDINYDL